MARARKRPHGLARRLVPAAAAAVAVLAIVSGVDREIDEHDLDVTGLSLVYGPAGPASEARVYLARDQAAAASEAALLAARRDPLGRGNVALAGTTQLLLGHADLAAPLFAAATLGGWRDPATQLWAMNQAFAANDPINAARRIDALARTGTSLPALEPFLEQLEAMPGGRQALLKRLAERPQWAEAFVGNAGKTAPGKLAARVETLVAINQAGLMPSPQALESGLWSVMASDPALAWSLHARILKGGGPVGGFAPAAIDQAQQSGSPFVWRLVNSGDYALTHRPGVLHFTPTAAGPVDALQRAAALAPGTYRYVWRATASSQVPPLMQVSCPRLPGEAGVIGRLKPGEGTLSVPANCPGQIFQLTLSGGADGRSFDVGEFTLAAAR